LPGIAKKAPPVETNGNSEDKTKDTTPQWKKNLEFIAAGIGIGLLVVNIFQMCTTNKAADAAKRAVDIATDTLMRSVEQFRIDERAWVEIEPIRPVLLHPAESGFGAMFKYEIYPKNVGKTVALNIVVKAQNPSSNISLGSHEDWMRNGQDKMLLDKFTYMGTGKPVIVPRAPVPKVIAPNTTSAVPFIINGQSPTYPNIEWVSYIIGRIDYTDQFQVPHWLKFCFYVANARGELWNCQEGNDEDHNPETTPADAATVTKKR
jgi:hypothetical protein